jgi:hypothetical protein
MKSCHKATISIPKNNDYVNTCIQSKTPDGNAYSYCDNKFYQYDKATINGCKKDMCNLCCVTMDAMKQKNYSYDNIDRCFNDCTNSKLFFI